MKEIKGHAYILGDDINTDDIVPSHTLTMRDDNDMAKHTLEVIDLDFAKNATHTNIIIAGHNFGTGSSREEAVNVFKILGIKAIVAKSFARIYFRNLINRGIPAIINDWKNDSFSLGDSLSISMDEGLIRNETKNITMKFEKIPKFLKNILDSGGILNQLRERLK